MSPDPINPRDVLYQVERQSIPRHSPMSPQFIDQDLMGCNAAANEVCETFGKWVEPGASLLASALRSSETKTVVRGIIQQHVFLAVSEMFLEATPAGPEKEAMYAKLKEFKSRTRSGKVSPGSSSAAGADPSAASTRTANCSTPGVNHDKQSPDDHSGNGRSDTPVLRGASAADSTNPDLIEMEPVWRGCVHDPAVSAENCPVGICSLRVKEK